MVRPDSRYVHAEFGEDEHDRLDAIKDKKDDFDVDWKTVLELGAQYLAELDERETDLPDQLAAQQQAAQLTTEGE